MKKKFDAFFSYNSKDEKEVRQIYEWLKESAQLSIYLDEWELITGDNVQGGLEEGINRSKSCVIFFGMHGVGRWQDKEVKGVIEKEVYDQKYRIIPVVLPDGKDEQIPLFLKDKKRVKFKSIDDQQALELLECGIRGRKPKRNKEELQAGIYPFRGLLPFLEEHKDIFFGRQELVNQLMSRLDETRFLAVVGESGCGKSSVVQAGLIPELRKNSEIILFTPGYRPLENLAAEILDYYQAPVPLLSKFIEDLKNPDELHCFARDILKRTGKTNLVIVIDQFETFLTSTPEEKHKQFIDAIINAVEKPDGPVKVVITLRSDFIGKCVFYPEWNKLVNDKSIQVQPMTEKELRDVIENPVKLTEIVVKPGLTKRIIEDVKSVDGYLPLLEHALTVLFEYCKTKQTPMTLEAYEAIGRIEGALIKHAESEFEKLNDTEKTVLQKMFILCLIQPGEGTQDTRRIATKEEIIAIGDDPAIPMRILTKWSRERLLICNDDSHGRQEIVAVPHEALIRRWDRLQGWLALGKREDARLMGILRQRVSEWIRSDYNKDFLFQKARLEIMKEFLEEHAIDLTDNERRFVSTSNAHQKKRKWLNRAGVIALFLILIVLVFLSIQLKLQEKSLQLNEKKLHIQLTRNYWERGRKARKDGKFLKSVHLLAEAASHNPDPAFRKALLLEINSQGLPISLLNVFKHKYPVWGSAFNHDGTLILTWSPGNILCLWDAYTEIQLGPPLKHGDPISGAIFNIDGTRFLTWNNDNVVRLWDSNKWQQIGLSVLEHKVWILGAAFNSAGTRILTWSDDRTVRIWDVVTGRQIGMAIEHTSVVNGAIFYADGARILTWSKDNNVQFWDAITCKQIKPAINHETEVLAVAFNQDETRIVIWCKDNTIRLWDSDTGCQIGPNIKHKGYFEEAISNAGGPRIQTWNSDYTTRLWTVDVAHQLKSIFIHKGWVIGAKFNANGTQILTWSEDKTARIWDAETGNQTGKALLHKGAVNGAIFNTDGTRVITWSDDNTLRIWDTETCNQIGTDIVHKGIVRGVILNKDETRILTWSDDNIAHFWDVGTGKPVGPSFRHKKLKWIMGAILNIDETLVLTWSDDHTAKIWDINTGKQICPDLEHKGIVRGAIFNKDETWALTWSDDKTARIWDVNAGKQICPPLKHKVIVRGAIFNKDETRILTWSDDKTVRIWDANTGEQIDNMEHNSAILGVTFNADETLMLTWSYDKTARIWDVGTTEQICPTLEHGFIIKGATFNKDSTLILTWSDDGTVKIWDVNTGTLVGPALVHKGRVNGAKFNPDESQILTWSDDNTARIWNIGLDLDYPKDKIKLQVRALTGTEFNLKTNEIEIIEPYQWKGIKKEYMKIAGEHYKKCRYRRFNVWSKLFPKEAEKIREQDN